MREKRARIVSMMALLFCMLASSGMGQRVPADKALLEQLQTTKKRFVAELHVAGITLPKPEPHIDVARGALVAFYEPKQNVVHMLRWETASMRARATFNLMAIYCRDGIPGKQLFRQSYYRIFFVHELAHWVQLQENTDATDRYALELEANRLAVAFWSERPEDRVWLAKMIERYREILQQLPNPVAKGEDRHRYFNENFEKWVREGSLQYGTYQLGMIVQAWDEPGRPKFAEMVRQLQKTRKEPI